MTKEWPTTRTGSVTVQASGCVHEDFSYGAVAGR